jgi:hypothetical protein
MSQGTPAAPALPLEILLSRLAQFCIPRDLCQIFRKGTTSQQFQFRCQQIFYVCDIAEREDKIPISINALVRAFDCPRTSVQSALGDGLEPRGERGKHLGLDADCEQQILDWIQQKTEQSTPVGKTEIKDYCTTQLKVSITRGWMNSFVAIRTKSSKRKVPIKNSSVCKSPECSWREQNSP